MVYVCLIMDDRNLFQGIIDILELEGHEVIGFQNGRECLEALKTLDRKPDVIISNNKMPNMTGLEVLKKLRSGETNIDYAFLPFIILSASSIDSVERQLLALNTPLGSGSTYYLRKPFDADELIALLEKILLSNT